MKLFSSIKKGVKAMIDDLNTPESFKMGQQFEDYVRENLFPANYFDLLERTHDYLANKNDYIKSSLKPDFKFRDRWTEKEIYVEAKFRTDYGQDKIVWCNDKQLLRYQEHDREFPVFLILGIRDDENSLKPEWVALIPISQIKYTGLFRSFINKFLIEPNKPITSKILWDR